MHLVIAIIKPARLADVRDALSQIGCKGMTVTDVKGFGQQKGHDELYRGAKYRAEFLPKIRLDIAVVEEDTQTVVDTIARASHTGSTGDGKVFVLPLQQALRIRTGETDNQAI